MCSEPEYHDREQRIYIADLMDLSGELQELKMTIEEVHWSEGYTEREDEIFELNGQYVTYKVLVREFGEAKIAAFIEEAENNAR